jgi:hypothetical protein
LFPVSQFVSNSVVHVVFLLTILLFALPAAIALLLTLVALPIAALVSLWLAPLGREIPLAGPYLDLTAEPAPPGTWLVAPNYVSTECGEPNPRRLMAQDV